MSRINVSPSSSSRHVSVMTWPLSSSVSTTKTRPSHPETRCASIGPILTTRFSPKVYSSTIARSKLMKSPAPVCVIFNRVPLSRNSCTDGPEERDRVGRATAFWRGMRIFSSRSRSASSSKPGAARNVQYPDRSIPAGTPGSLGISTGLALQPARTSAVNRHMAVTRTVPIIRILPLELSTKPGAPRYMRRHPPKVGGRQFVQENNR